MCYLLLFLKKNLGDRKNKRYSVFLHKGKQNNKRGKERRETETQKRKKKRKNQPWEKLVQQAETGWNDFKEKKYESKAT